MWWQFVCNVPCVACGRCMRRRLRRYALVRLSLGLHNGGNCVTASRRVASGGQQKNMTSSLGGGARARTTQALPVFVFVLLSFPPFHSSFLSSLPSVVGSVFRSFFLSFFLPLVFLTSVHFELVEQRFDLRHGAVHDGVEPRRRRQLRRRDFPRQHLELRSI